MASKEQIKNLKYVFEPKSIAVLGASPIPNKVSNVIVKALVEGGYPGELYFVNPKYSQLYGKSCHPDLASVGKKVECAIIATPAQTVPPLVEECARRGVKGIVLVTAGFGEAGEEGKKIEEVVVSICNKNNIALIGPNCLGVNNPATRVDSIFLPIHKLERPKPGNVAFVTQSGAVGSTIIDIAAYNGVGISKFVSYGNAAVINELDLLEYLEHDPKTKTIIAYVEGVKNGRKFYDAIKRINRKKPIVILKAGKYGKSAEAAKSHTGNIAGSYLAYKAAFRQAKVVEAEGLEDLFDFMKIFSQPLPKGNKIAIVTNGGGLGVLTADEVEKQGLVFAQYNETTKTEIKKILPDFGAVANPLDLIAEANGEKYEKAIETMMQDDGIDAILIITLFQTPPMDEKVLNVLIKASDDQRKPIATISLGGEYTEGYQKHLNTFGVPVFTSPNAAVRAMKKLIEYADFRRKLK